MNTIYLHIGMHKTGTTSLQRYCMDHTSELSQQGYSYYVPRYWSKTGCANEIASLILRDGVWNGFANNIDGLEGTEIEREIQFSANVGEHLTNFLKVNKNRKIIISGEHISLLRTAEEAVRLKQLLSQEYSRIHLIIAMREKKSWWRSYCNQIQKRPRKADRQYNSMAFLDKSGWLTDFDSLIFSLKNEFEDLEIISYNDNVVENILGLIGVSGGETGIIRRKNNRVSFVKICQSKLLYHLRRGYSKYFSDTFWGRSKRRILRKSVFKSRK